MESKTYFIKKIITRENVLVLIVSIIKLLPVMCFADWQLWVHVGRNSTAACERGEESYPPWRVPPALAHAGHYGRPPPPQDVAHVGT